MSGGGGQTTSTSNAPPPEFTEAYKKVNAQAANVASVPYDPYPGQTVAGMSPDQMRGISDVQSASGIATPYINAASQYISDATKPIWSGVQQFSPEAIQQYQSPYTNDVINATQAQFNNQNAIQQQGIVGNAISQGAFGGDRAAVAQGITAGQQQLAQAPVLAGLRNQGYNQALGEFNQQQGAQIGANQANAWLNSQAGQAMAGLGQEALGTSLTGANALLGIGGLEQTQAQASLNGPYQQWLAAQAYPYQSTGWLANIAEGLGGASGGSSSSTVPGPSVASQLGGGALATAGILGQTGAFGSNGYLTGSGGLFGSGGGGGGYVDSGTWSSATGGAIPHRAPGGGISDMPAPGMPMQVGVPNLDLSIVPGADGMGVSPASHGKMAILKDYGSTSHTSGNGDTGIGSLLKAAGTIAAGIYGGPAGGMAASALSSQVHFDRGGGIVPFPTHRARAPGGGITANDNWGMEPVRHFASGGYDVSTVPSSHNGPAVPVLSYSAGHPGGITAEAPQSTVSGGIAPSSVQDYLAAQHGGAYFGAPKGYVAPPPPPPAPIMPTDPLSEAIERMARETSTSGAEGGGGRASGGIVALDEGGDVPVPISSAPEWNDEAAFAARNEGLPDAPQAKGFGQVTGDVPYKLAHAGIATETPTPPREKNRGIVSDAADVWHQPYTPGAVNVSALIRRGESGDVGDTNVKNPKSSAQGPDQFTSGTWNEFLASDAGRGYTQADRSNANANTVATNWLADQNATKIRGVTGVQPTVGQVAAAHLLGGQGAAALLAHPNDPISNYLEPSAISGNARILRPDMTGAEAVNAVERYYASGATSGGGGGGGGSPAGIFTGATTSQPVSSGIMPPMPASDVVEPPAYSPWRTLTNVGLGILGGTSPNAGTNIGRGALHGVEISDKEKQAEATQALARQQASASNMFRKAQLTLEGARADQTERHQTTDENLRRQGLEQNNLLRRDAMEQRGRERADALMPADVRTSEWLRTATPEQREAYNQSLKDKQTFRAGASNIPPETKTMLAEQVLAGNNSALAGLGSGSVGSANRMEVNNEVTRLLHERNPNATGADIAAKTAEFMGEKAGARTAGTREATVSMAVTEAQKFMPLALAASEKVDRTQFPTINSIIQAYDKGTGDENIVRLAVATNSLTTAYSRAVTPSGVPTEGAQHRAHELLDKAWSKGQYKAAIDQLMIEMDAAKASPVQVQKEQRERISGRSDGASGQSSKPAATPAQPPRAVGPGGKTITYTDGAWRDSDGKPVQ